MMDPKKIQAVTDWSTSKTICDVQCSMDLQISIKYSSKTVLK
jgi:hypothetical protein